MLGGDFLEATMKNPSTEEDSVMSMIVWLYCVPDVPFPKDKLVLIAVKDVWYTIELTNKYFFKIEQLNAWFHEYFEC